MQLGILIATDYWWASINKIDCVCVCVLNTVCRFCLFCKEGRLNKMFLVQANSEPNGCRVQR